MPTEYSENVTAEVIINEPLGGPQGIAFTFPQTAGSTQNDVTGAIATSPIRPTEISGRSPYTLNQEFTLHLGYEIGGAPVAGSCSVTPVRTGVLPGTIMIDDSRREVKTFNTSMDFQADGNVLVTIDLQPLEEQQFVTLIVVKAQVGSGSETGLALTGLAGNIDWDGSPSLEASIAYMESRTGLSGQIHLTGQVTVTGLAAQTIRSATITASGYAE